MSNENEFSLVEMEDNYIVSSSGLSRHRPGLYPSEASVEYMQDNQRVVAGKCMREAWYRSMREEREQASPGLMQKANSGKWNEEGLIARWKEMGIWVDNNVKFYNKKYYLSGELDAVIRSPITGNLIGTEIKSYYGHYANKEITGSKRPPVGGRPKDTHFLQSVVYAWEYRKELEEYRIYYIERGDGHRVEFRIGFDELPSGEHQVWWQQIPGKYWNFFMPGKVLQPYNIEDVYRRFDRLVNLLQTKTLPDKDFSSNLDTQRIEWMWNNGMLGKTKYETWKKNPEKNKLSDWQCSYCFFKDACERDEA